MSGGIKHGTKLEQLEQLEQQVQRAIQLERIRVAKGEPSRPIHRPSNATPTQPELEPPSKDSLVTVPLAYLATNVVRDWCRSNGWSLTLTGPIGDRAKAAFIEAHR